MMDALVTLACRLLLLALVFSCVAVAAPRQMSVSPPGSKISFRAYGMGLIPIDASFTQFDGWLTYDPADKTTCHVELIANVASVMTGNDSTRATLIGSAFMDAVHYPDLTYVGNCGAQGVNGTLGLHGVTKPFSLSLTWTRDGVEAEGRLVRADWGMTTLPLLGGRTVRIRVTIPLRGED